MLVPCATTADPTQAWVFPKNADRSALIPLQSRHARVLSFALLSSSFTLTDLALPVSRFDSLRCGHREQRARHCTIRVRSRVDLALISSYSTIGVALILCFHSSRRSNSTLYGASHKSDSLPQLDTAYGQMWLGLVPYVEEATCTNRNCQDYDPTQSWYWVSLSDPLDRFSHPLG